MTQPADPAPTIRKSASIVSCCAAISGSPFDCHCKERGDAAIPIELRTLVEIAASLRSSQ
jgi:hypothetical protein